MLGNDKKQLSVESISNLGILIFVFVYLAAAQLYPSGFIWTKHYWCDILNAQQVRFLAITGHFVLCLSLGLFFYRFAQKLGTTPQWKNVIRNSGILSIVAAFFIYTSYHDFFISFSNVAGIPALLGIGLALRQNQVKHLLNTGYLCVILFVVNNVVYYSEFGINYLPLIQKVTFAITLFWIFTANRYLISLKKQS